MSMFDCPHCGDTHHVNDFCATGPMSQQAAPSNANTSGLGDVGLSETYRFAYESIRNGAPGLSDATCAAIARSINMKVSLAANDRATAAEARADRLAEVEGDLNDRAEACLSIVATAGDDPSKARIAGKAQAYFHAAELVRAALQQETQP